MWTGGGRGELKKWKAVQVPKTQLEEETAAEEETNRW